MLKVLIIDDEVKICKLIQCLIDWKELGYEIVGTCHDGYLALDTIRLYNPDVIITDIRMPGCDGLSLIEKAQAINPNLHFIIVSGYGQFDYAQKAIKYGVSDYLLKPIKEKELKKSLISIREKCNDISEQNQKTVRIQNELTHTQKRIKSNFINDLLLNPRMLQNYPAITQINDAYYTDFSDTSFAVACICLDTVQPEPSPDITQFILNKITDMISVQFQPFHDNLTAVTKRSVYLLINDTEETISQKLYPTLKTLKSSILLLREICPPLHILIAQSGIKSDFRELPDCLEEITVCLHEKVISGTDSIFVYSQCLSSDIFPGDLITPGFRSQFMVCIETFNYELLDTLITDLIRKLQQLSHVSGHLIFLTYNELIELFLFSIKQYKINIASEDVLRQHWVDSFSNFDCISAPFKYLQEEWSQLLSDHQLHRQKSQSKAVLLAKQYINEHYADPLTLETIGQIVGLNPSYFSSIFRKESGCTFIDYLTELRMKKARELIVDTDLEIIEIAEQTGFHDLKYFSRCFRKNTGMTPVAYRKLFS